MNPKVDHYLATGCGRCPLGGTPDCKVLLWTHPLERLRNMLLRCGLTEELKWGHPCYTLRGKNVALLGAFKDTCVLSFLKGVLLQDPHGLLEKPGENSHEGRVIRFSNEDDVLQKAAMVEEFIRQAIAVEEAGLKIPKREESEEIPAELQARLEEMPELQAAFSALTPGRQRGYILHIAGAKQSATRAARVEKCIPAILAGRGFFDR